MVFASQKHADTAPPAADPHNGVAIVRRIATYAPGSVVPAILTLATSVVFTRVFDATEFGVYSLVLVVATTVKVFLTMWLMQAIGKFLPAETTEQGRSTIKSAISLATLGTLVIEALVAVPVLLIGTAMVPPEIQSFVGPAVAFVLVGSVFDILGTVFPSEHRATASVTFKLTDSVATFLLRLFLVSALVGMGIEAMLWSVFLSNLVLVPMMWRAARLPRPTRAARALGDATARNLVGGFLRYGLPMALWYFAGLLLDVADRFVIGYFKGPADVGIYDANYRLITGAVALIIVPITATLAPVIMGASGTANRDLASRTLGRIIEILLVVGVMAVGVVAVAYPYIGLLLGPEFRTGSVVMPIVLAGVFAFNIGTFAHKPFEMTGRTRPMLALIVVAAVVNIGLNILLVPPFGFVGAAYATVLAYCLYTVAVSRLGRRIIPWQLDQRYLLRNVGPLVLACAFLVPLRVWAEGRGGLLGAVLVFAGCTLLGLWTMLSVVQRLTDDRPAEAQAR